MDVSVHERVAKPALLLFSLLLELEIFTRLRHIGSVADVSKFLRPQ
jgi:hypothetical protein